MLDILGMVHGLADSVTASRIRCVCKKLSKLIVKPTKYIYNNRIVYKVGKKFHREAYPAVERNDGTKMWYFHGELHREDGPAVEWRDGAKEWYLHGLRHREDGPAAEWSNGDRCWYLHGQLHREDGPAIERSNGGKWWYLAGVQYK